MGRGGDVVVAGDLFQAARIGLGALGVITEVELQCEPEFALHAREVPMPLRDVLDHIHHLADQNDHFEFFWFPNTEMAATKTNNRLRPGEQRRPLPPVRAWIEDEFLANTCMEWSFRTARRWPAIIPKLNSFPARHRARRSPHLPADRGALQRSG